MTPALLNSDHLERFASLLRARGIPVDDLQPGLTDAQIDEITGPVNLELPDEMRAWWRWRNGEPARTYIPILPAREPLSLQEAVDSYINRVDSGLIEPARSLCPVIERPLIFVQCTGAGAIAAPVYRSHDYPDPPELVLPSFGELVLTWISYIENVYSVDPDGGWASRQTYPTEVLDLGVQ